jgi:hypothetical protein
MIHAGFAREDVILFGAVFPPAAGRHTAAKLPP